MITLTEDQLATRWDTLPDSLKDAIMSEVNSDFLWKTAEDEHIPDEKIYGIAKIMGQVLLGFIHPEDVASEIKESLDLPAQTAMTLQTALNNRVFAPLKADIDKIYQPIGASVPAAAAATISIAPVATSSTIDAPLIFNTSVPINSNAVPAKPNLSDRGWSKARVDAPVVQLDITKRTAVAPAQAAMQMPRPAATPASKAPAAASALGEFARLGLNKEPSAAAATPSPAAAPMPVAAPTPAPVMLQQDTSSVAPQKNSDFHLSKPGGEAQMQFSTGKIVQTAQPAILDFGKKSAASTAATSTQPTKVVHYSEFKPSLASVPTANSGPRTVSEITSGPAPMPVATPTPLPSPAQVPTPVAPMPPAAMPATPKPPAPPVPTFVSKIISSTTPTPSAPSPMPSSIPTPASAPAIASIPTPSDTPKVIVKDFL